MSPKLWTASPDRVPVQFMMDEDLREWLAEQAQRFGTGITMTDFVAHVVRQQAEFYGLPPPIARRLDEEAATMKGGREDLVSTALCVTTPPAKNAKGVTGGPVLRKGRAKDSGAARTPSTFRMSGRLREYLAEFGARRDIPSIGAALNAFLDLYRQWWGVPAPVVAACEAAMKKEHWSRDQLTQVALYYYHQGLLKRDGKDGK